MVDSNLLDNMGVLYTKSYPPVQVGMPMDATKNLWENLWESDIYIYIEICGDDSK